MTAQYSSVLYERHPNTYNTQWLMQSSALDKLGDSDGAGGHAAQPFPEAQAILTHTAGATMQPLLRSAEMHPPAQDFRSGIVLVHLNVVAYCIGSVQANDASHLQLLVVHNVLHNQNVHNQMTQQQGDSRWCSDTLQQQQQQQQAKQAG